MSKIKDFYEQGSTKCNSVQRWFMWKLYYMFKKYYVDRSVKCIELIQKLDLSYKEKIYNVLDVGCGKWSLLLDIYKKLPNIENIFWIDIDEIVL